MHSLTPADYNLLLAVPAIPFAGYLIQIFFGRFLPRKGDWMLTGGMAVVAAITVYMFFKALGHEGTFFNESSQTEGGPVFRWLYSSPDKPSGLNLTAGILYDGLGAAMLMVVGVVSFCVHLFSTGYMHGDRRYHIFFANISLFTFAMLGLVISDNILFLFIFWELMGLMSYLLIGHFSQDPDSHRIKQAAAACKKAFMTTRVGDTCLMFGMAMTYFLLPREYNQLVAQGLIEGDMVQASFVYTDLWNMASAVVTAGGGYPAWMTIAGLFMFGGTMGKSAQFPLHIWLPDAMEGPTPVSAMIHAATMVASGIFLLGRIFPLMSPEVLGFVTAVGAATALFAATIGCTVFDIKGVLAYSTISQLGFMVAAIGTGALGLVAGLFHMVTHAFFKACLFMSAGSVIHGCHHEQDMRKMGGLAAKIPLTYYMMVIGTLAITGIGIPLTHIGFAGFLSKDIIIESTFAGHNSAHMYAFWMLVIAACMTSFYSWRLIFLTFHGETRADQHTYDHAHESPNVMMIPLYVLATGAVLAGMIWYGDFVGHHEGEWWAASIFNGPDNHVLHDAHEVPKWVKVSPFIAMLLGLGVAMGMYLKTQVLLRVALGVLAAIVLFIAKLDWWLALAIGAAMAGLFAVIETGMNKGLAERNQPLYQFLLNKWYFDEIYDFIFVRPAMWVGRFFWKKGDGSTIDGFLNGVAMGLVPWLTRFAGRVQSGYVFHYAFAMLIGVSAIITWFAVSGGAH